LQSIQFTNVASRVTFTGADTGISELPDTGYFYGHIEYNGSYFASRSNHNITSIELTSDTFGLMFKDDIFILTQSVWAVQHNVFANEGYFRNIPAPGTTNGIDYKFFYLLSWDNINDLLSLFIVNMTKWFYLSRRNIFRCG